jgi:hypothetical protein
VVLSCVSNKGAHIARTTFLVLAAAACLSACAEAPPERQIVDGAAEALGGADRILAMKTLVVEGEGTNGNVGQDMTADATSQTFTASGYQRAIDLSNGRTRVEQTRTPNFTFSQGPAAQKQVQGLDGEVACSIAPSSTTTRLRSSARRSTPPLAWVAPAPSAAIASWTSPLRTVWSPRS